MVEEVNLYMIEKTVDLNEIKVPTKRLRSSVEKTSEMERLKDSIKKLGLFHPILVDEDYNLIAGFRRLTAFKELKLEVPQKFDKIPVRIMPKVDRAKRLEAEIHENWVRKQFKGYELDVGLAELKKIHQELNPDSKRGATLKRGKDDPNIKKATPSRSAETAKREKVKTPRFAQSMAKELGVKESTVEKRVRVGKAINDGVFDKENVEEYKKGLKTHTQMLKTYEKKRKEEKKEKEKAKLPEIAKIVLDKLPWEDKVCADCRFYNGKEKCPHCHEVIATCDQGISLFRRIVCHLWKGKI